MKTAIVTWLCVMTVLSLTSADLYTDKWDNADLDEILSNRRLLESYVKCVLDMGSCTADGQELKSHVREIFETDCAKCTETQKKGADRVIKHLINEEPAYWQQVSGMYDPEKKYTLKYEERLRNVKA